METALAASQFMVIHGARLNMDHKYACSRFCKNPKGIKLKVKTKK